MLVKTLLLVSLLVAAYGRDINLINNCGYKIWPGWYGQNGTPDGGGTTLDAGASHTINVPDDWTSGRVWARTGCDDSFNCDTGGCGNSEQCNGAWGQAGVSLAEFGLNKWEHLDFYDVSLVDGFNVQVTIVPNGGSGDCKGIGSCSENLLDSCPDELKLQKDGNTIECQSACTKFGNPEYCCTGDHGTPDTCGPSDYSKFFKDRCPDDYSYAYDDQTSTFTCNGANYEVHFCGSNNATPKGRSKNHFFKKLGISNPSPLRRRILRGNFILDSNFLRPPTHVTSDVNERPLTNKKHQLSFNF